MAFREILVLGGNGMVGQAVCREAIKRGMKVSSLSRSGPPASIDKDELLGKVTWIKGSASDPQSYKGLKHFDGYVHCVGRLLESKSAKYEELSYNTTQAMMGNIHEDAVVAYLSADDFSRLGSWMLPGYFHWKRSAEQLLEAASEEGQIKRSVILRPGIITSSERPLSVIIGYIYFLLYFVAGGLLPPTKTAEQVARAVIDGMERGGRYEVIPANSI